MLQNAQDMKSLKMLLVAQLLSFIGTIQAQDASKRNISNEDLVNFCDLAVKLSTSLGKDEDELYIAFGDLFTELETRIGNNKIPCLDVFTSELGEAVGDSLGAITTMPATDSKSDGVAVVETGTEGSSRRLKEERGLLRAVEVHSAERKLNDADRKSLQELTERLKRMLEETGP